MKKTAMLLVWLLAMFSNTVRAQEVTIGKDNLSLSLLLLNDPYSYSQVIYKQEWIHAKGEINKIAYYIDYSEGPILDVSIYMGHTTKKAFENGIFNKDWIPFDDLTLVYNGNLNFPTTPGWFEIALQTPFAYNNNENLVIAIDRNSPDTRNIVFKGSRIDSDQSLAILGESVDIDPASPININAPNIRCPNIKLSGDLVISPYLYIYNPEKNISTSPGSIVSFDIETNQTVFDSYSDQPWLTVSNDITNKKIIATTAGSSGNLSDWEKPATITVSASGIDSDTAHLHKYRFEPIEIKTGNSYFVDFDNEGDLDIVGNGLSIVRNDGNGVFTTIENSIFSSNSINYFADYDNDGDLDFLYKGDSVKIYRNDGNGILKDIKVFKEQLKFDEAEYISTPWCDYDNDGDYDLLLSGTNQKSEPNIYLYENVGKDGFTKINISFKAVTKGTTEWIDYNRDGYKDIMLSGTDINGSPSTNLYKNIGNGKFNLIDYPFPKLFNGRFSWGDYDTDGDPDLIIAGSSVENLAVPQGAINKIFRNDGDDHFRDISSNFQLFYSGSSKWADLDNDGDLDIVMFGYTTSYYSKALLIYYENKGNNQFTEFFRKESMEVVMPNSISLGNYDNDGDPDFLLQTKNWENYRRLFRNNYNNSNVKPSCPDKFGVKREGTKTILYWNSGSDTETPSKALKYNIRIGSSPGSSDIICPFADLNTGFVKFPDMINCADTFKILENIPLGKYYYSVQSIDNMLAGSEFSPEQSFFVIEPFSELPLGTVSLGNASLATGDYDNDGDYDYIISGRETYWSNCYTKIFDNNGDSTFTESGISLIQMQGYVAWGDYDNDNDLDIQIAGRDDNNINKTIIYRNDGNGVFTDIGFKEILGAKALWADFDNDGDLDIMLGSRTFKNYGNDSLSFFNDIKIEGHPATLAIADYDKDNDLDVLTIASGTGLFSNETGSFIRTNNDFYNPVNMAGSAEVDWFDYNNDGLTDLIITGQDTTYSKQTVIYKNTGVGSFTEIFPEMRAVTQGSFLTGDYNGDRNSDIVLAGMSNEHMLKVYENDGFEKLRDVYTNLSIKAFPYFYIITWMDYNNDGHLDILTNYNLIFSNNSNREKTLPEAPINLQTEKLGFNVNFSWEKPTKDSHYSYNLRVGTTPGGTELMSPMADVVTGKRLILDKGNAQLNTGWTLKNLKPAQTYYWSVQSVDASYRGGEWAPEKSFTMQNIYPAFAADTACAGFPTSFSDMSVSPLGDITSWKWDFGDGNTSTLQNPTNTYKSSGNFTVKLVVKTASFADSVNKTVVVKPKPYADFTADVVCQGEDTPILNSTNLNDLIPVKWEWDFGDKQKSTLKDPEKHGYVKAGEYEIKLLVKTDNGCYDSIQKPAIVGSYPVAVITANDVLTFCSDDSVTLSVSPVTNYLYNWQRDDVGITNANSPDYKVKLSGSYTVEVTNTSGNCKTKSKSVPVTSLPKPAVPLIITDNYVADVLCPLERSITLSVDQPVAGYNYQWTKNGTPLSNASESSYSGFITAGDYTVIASKAICSNESAIKIIKYKSAPEKPEVLVRGPAVWYMATSKNTYQKYRWYHEDKLINGADKYLYVANKTLGTYRVEVSEDVCFTSSDDIIIPTSKSGMTNFNIPAEFIVGEETGFAESIKIFPNPTTGLVQYEMDNKLIGDMTITILTLDGKEIRKQKVRKDFEYLLDKIDLTEYSRGNYLIKFELNNTVVIKKIILE